MSFYRVRASLWAGMRVYSIGKNIYHDRGVEYARKKDRKGEDLVEKRTERREVSGGSIRRPDMTTPTRNMWKLHRG